MDNGRKGYWKSVSVLLLVVAAIFVAGWFSGRRSGRFATEKQIERVLGEISSPTNKLTYTLSLIGSQYVDEVPMDSIVEHMMPRLMEQLDPHSVYIPASEMQ